MSKYLHLYNGKRLNLDNVFTEENKNFDLGVIPLALSKICRYTGHCKILYSVAEHSINVYSQMYIDMQLGKVKKSNALLLAALMHDAHECLTGFGDVNTPVKTRDIKFAEANINSLLAEKLNIDPLLFYHPDLKRIDLNMLKTEVKYITNIPIDDLHPDVIKNNIIYDNIDFTEKYHYDVSVGFAITMNSLITMIGQDNADT